jgi:hypothetical protein
MPRNSIFSIDELFTAWPFLGSRRMARLLKDDGRAVNRARLDQGRPRGDEANHVGALRDLGGSGRWPSCPFFGG